MKKLIVFFPGAGYGMDCPLLYYADFLFETNGYERIHMNYQNILARVEISLEERLQILRKYTWSQVQSINFNEYEEIVFLSKSVGAVEAGIIAEKLDAAVKQIFLTPTEEAAIYLKSDSYVVIGTNDKAYQSYKTYCEEKSVRALYIEGADHSLEIVGKPYESIKALEKVMRFIESEV